MRIAHILGAGLLWLAASVTAGDAAIALGRDSFGEFIKNNPIVMADFWVPWCGHCTKFAPTFEAAAKALTDFPVKLVKVDCEKYKDLCKSYGVNSYPTMKIFTNGKQLYHDYDGPRRLDAIVHFMKKQMLPTLSFLVSQQDHDNFLANNAGDAVLMGYIPGEDTEKRAIVRQAAEKLHEDYPVALLHDPGVAQAVGVPCPSLVLHKADGEGKIVFNGAWGVDAIKDFVKKSHRPLFGELDAGASWDEYVSGEAGPTLFLFAPNEPERKRLADTLRPVARKYKDKLNFATAAVPEFALFARYLRCATAPGVAIYDGKNRRKYNPAKTKYGTDDAVTESSVTAFVEGFLAGTLEPTIVSQEPSELQTSGPVTEVAAKTFDEVVLDDSRDVLLLYHNPGCPFCQSLYGAYDILAKMYDQAGRKDKVRIARIDVTRNDLFDNIAYVPTIKLYKAGDKDRNNAVLYKGDRSIKDMAAFLHDEGANRVDAPPAMLIHEGEGQDHGGAAIHVDELHQKPLQGQTRNNHHVHQEL